MLLLAYFCFCYIWTCSKWMNLKVRKCYSNSFTVLWALHTYCTQNSNTVFWKTGNKLISLTLTIVKKSLHESSCERMTVLSEVCMVNHSSVFVSPSLMFVNACLQLVLLITLSSLLLKAEMIHKLWERPQQGSLAATALLSTYTSCNIEYCL